VTPPSEPVLFRLPGREGSDLECGPGRPAVMGILNLTPDSFSDGGLHRDPCAVVEHAEGMESEGADILDLGAESTRPGALAVPVEEERSRLLPVLEALRPRTRLPLSIDTRRAEVARDALALGADWINDVSALADPPMASVIAESKACIVLMHMQGEPSTMQDSPGYEDPVAEVKAFLERRMAFAVDSGIEESRILLDPGIGFGKRVEDNTALLRRLEELAALGRPILLGLSRKSLLGHWIEKNGGSDEGPGSRDPATAAAVALSQSRGVSVHRVHEVRYARQALAVHAGLSGRPAAGRKVSGS